MLSSDTFFKQLPVHKIPINDLLGRESLFHTFPPDWQIIITDIKQSTKAVADGSHELVNLIATGSIIAVLNLASENDIEVPFFFGGDGATIVIPGSLLDPAMKALKEHQQNALRDFNLELRVGSVKVSDVYAKNHELKIARHQVNNVYNIPIIIGNGLSYAEETIKSQPISFSKRSGSSVQLNLQGMQCRWDRVKPPENKTEIISLLVVNQDDYSQAQAYKKVFDLIYNIYGDPDKRTPISVSRLNLKASLDNIKQEMQVKLGKFNPLYLLSNWVAVSIGKVVFPRTPTGKKYMRMLVQLSDTLVMDGRLNTVMSGTSDQCAKLTKALDEMESNGEILYGFYVSQASIMSCYVRDQFDKHIHFIDGSDGGYTQAAKMLKRKIAGKRAEGAAG